MRYNFVAEVQSDSNPDKMYTIKMQQDGMLTCNCPSWIFNQRRNRTCKHIDRVIRAGFTADNKGKFIVGTDRWGEKVPVFCKSFKSPACDDCQLRFLCFTERVPQFDINVLRKAGIPAGKVYN